MEAVFSCMTSSGCQEKGVHQVASLKNSDIFSSKKTGIPRSDQLQCSYSLYDHSSRIASKYFFCRGCKTPVKKEMLHKCQTCGTSVSSSQSWLLAALAGGFHKLQGEQSHIISRSTDPKSAAEDWINNCLESVLTLPIVMVCPSPATTWKQSSAWGMMTFSCSCQNKKDCTNFAQSSVSHMIFMTTQTFLGKSLIKLMFQKITNPGWIS